MASGYGRGGRGAALLAALGEPPRKPGDPQPQPTPGPVPSVTAGQPVGRGAMLQALLQQQSKAAPAAQPSALPVGRGQALAAASPTPSAEATPPRPFGRGGAGMLAQQQLAASAPAASTAPAAAAAAVPLGRGMIHLQQQAMVQQEPPTSPGIPSPSVKSPQPGGPGAQPVPPATGQGAGEGERRLTSLEFMLKNMKIKQDNAPVHRHGELGRPMDLSANYINIKCRNEGVYQYSVSFCPDVDSRNIRYKLLHEHTEVIGNVRAFDGAILFLPIKLKETETVMSGTLPTDGSTVTLRVKLVKVLPPDSCVQLYNVIFRKIMSILKMCQVGRHYYDPYRPVGIPQHKLEVWPGYITAAAEYEGGLMLLTDVSHRVLRTETVLSAINDVVQPRRRQMDVSAGDKKATIERLLIGVTVITRYNNKTYRVDDIAWDQSPETTFESSTGDKVSFIEYYRKAYNKVIQDHQQPLLIHRPKKKDRQRGKAPLEVVCLVPELCHMTGLTDELRKDFKVMKDLGTHTRVTPNQRRIGIQKFCENVNSHPEARAELEKWGLSLESDTIRLIGRQFPQERILTGRKECPSGPRSDWTGAATSEVISAVHLRSWMIVFARVNASVAREFLIKYQEVGSSMGIRVEAPVQHELPNERTDTYLTTIRQNLNSDVQCVVCIFPTSRDDRYSALKKLCCVEAPVPSQVINSRTISRKEKLRSVVQKIALQINCKLGGELWAVKIPMKSLMVCGIDVFHDKAGPMRGKSVGAFVASINASCTRWYSRVCHQMSGQELIDALKPCFIAALRKFHEVNHALPKCILVYRDGVGDGQLPMVAGYEVEQLERCFHHFGEGYQPKLSVVVVQKRINTRIFERKNNSLENPPPGTVVDHTINRRDWYDFFLVSQHVTQGTVTPTHYVVVHDGSDLSPDRIQMLTYKMTHLYYNWPGTVRVPAPCQYAHKLAYLVGQSVHKDPALDLCDRLFYL